MDILTPSSIERRREALGLTREALSAIANVDGATIWRIEKGKAGGTIATWRSILAALDELERGEYVSDKGGEAA